MHSRPRMGGNHKVSLRRRVQSWESLGSGRAAAEPPYYRTPTLIGVKTGTSLIPYPAAKSIRISGTAGHCVSAWNQVADHAREGTHGASTAANRGERCSAQLQYLYGREPRQLSRKEARFLHPHRAKPVQRLWLSHKVSLDRAALCLNSVKGLRFPYI